MLIGLSGGLLASREVGLRLASTLAYEDDSTGTECSSQHHDEAFGRGPSAEVIRLCTGADLAEFSA